MATPLRPATAGTQTSAPRNADRFDRSLRFEWADPEQRVLLWSWAFSIGLGILWLIFVAMHKIQPPQLLSEAEQGVEISLAEALPEEVATQPVPQAGAAEEAPAPGPTNKPKGETGPKGKPKPGRPGAPTERNRTGEIGNAFGTGSGAGTGGMTGDVSGILRGVAVSSGSGGTGGGRGGTGGGGAGGKAVLGYGQGGQGGTTPGRGGFGGGTGTGGGGGGGGIGGVGGGGGVTRAAVRVAAPRPIAAEDLGGARRDVGELGQYVRSRESQLRFCYQEYGLKTNPSLAGTINVAITLTGSGNVTDVDINSRTWGGAGASETESCIRGKIQSWRFPSSSAGGGTYSFPFNFTK
jgi:hypothetical protein